MYRRPMSTPARLWCAPRCCMYLRWRRLMFVVAWTDTRVVANRHVSSSGGGRCHYVRCTGGGPARCEWYDPVFSFCSCHSKLICLSVCLSLCVASPLHVWRLLPSAAPALVSLALSASSSASLSVRVLCVRLLTDACLHATALGGQRDLCNTFVTALTMSPSLDTFAAVRACPSLSLSLLSSCDWLCLYICVDIVVANGGMSSG